MPVRECVRERVFITGSVCVRACMSASPDVSFTVGIVTMRHKAIGTTQFSLTKFQTCCSETSVFEGRRQRR